MKTPNKKPKVETWGLDRIQPNTHQPKVPLAEADVERAAVELRRDGRREPLDVLPDGTLVDDAVVVEAARKLGWTEITVRVRHDLDQPRDAALAFLAAAGRRLDRLAPGYVATHRVTLVKAAETIRVLLAHADRPEDEPAADIGDLAAEFAALKGARHSPGKEVSSQT